MGKRTGKAPKPTVMYCVEEWYHDSITKKSRCVATICRNIPFKIAQFNKRMEDLKNKPKGTYHTVPKLEDSYEIKSKQKQHDTVH